MINEISGKLPSQFLFNKVTTSFDKTFDRLSMNNRFEAAKFESGLPIERLLIISKMII